MDERWSLDELYTSFQSEEFKEDLKSYEKVIEKLKQWADVNFTGYDVAAKKIGDFITMLNELERYDKLFQFSSLTMSTDALHETAAKMDDILDELSTGLTEPYTRFKKYVSELDDFDAAIASNEVMREHSFILMEIRDNSRYMLSEKEEIIISKMRNTGSSAWSKLKEQLTSTLLVDITIDGVDKKEPLTVVRNYAYESDANLRQTAYEAELASYAKIEKSVAASLNGIKGEVLTISQMRGYKSPLDMTLAGARMDEETLDAMLSSMRDYLPAFEKYFLHKAKLLGHTGALPFYDLFAPVGQADMKFSYEEASKYVVKNFTDFSKKLGDYAQRAIDNHWMDVYPREGKQGGAFCAGMHALGESRILLNFGGAFNDVTTMAHELGHGYHNECLKAETSANADYTMPIAETASTFCETIIINAALKTASREEALVILENDISGAAQVIVDIYSRFMFEDEVFKRRVNGALSVPELKEVMLEAQKKAYGGGLDHQLLHPYMWICKPHYYYAGANYYNFPYAYGFLFSKGLYAKYLSDGQSFVEAYDRLLNATGRNNLYEIGLLAGINVRDKAFWDSSLKLVEEEIDSFIKL